MLQFLALRSLKYACTYSRQSAFVSTHLRQATRHFGTVYSQSAPCIVHTSQAARRFSTARSSDTPNFGFAFDIDGVLVRGQKPLPGAQEALAFLKTQQIPFILLTNGGGYHEERRAKILSHELGLPLEAERIVQSHTPFSRMDEYKDKTCMIVGGEGDLCRGVAEQYGFKKVVTTADIYTANPTIWPFSKPFAAIHTANSRTSQEYIGTDRSGDLKIDAIFVYNDPRDWGLDLSIIIDCLLSSQGYIGTISSKNNDPNLPNRGYQQDGQPPLFFSNADLIFAGDFSLPRLGQGGFREALEGVWSAVTGGSEAGVQLNKTVIGKPYPETYLFAEKVLRTLHKDPLNTVYMIGDNPESDIKGASQYKSPYNTTWLSALVRTGVYNGGTPSAIPTTICDNVYDAVQWGLQNSQWRNRLA